MGYSHACDTRESRPNPIWAGGPTLWRVGSRPGHRCTAHGTRRTAHGAQPSVRRSTAHGPRPTVHGPRPMAYGPRPTATAHGKGHTAKGTRHTADGTRAVAARAAPWPAAEARAEAAGAAPARRPRSLVGDRSLHSAGKQDSQHVRADMRGCGVGLGGMSGAGGAPDECGGFDTPTMPRHGRTHALRHAPTPCQVSGGEV